MTIDVLLPFPRHPASCIKLLDMKQLVKQIYDIDEIFKAIKNKHHYAHENKLVKHYSFPRNKEFLVIYECMCTRAYIKRHFHLNNKLADLSTENSVSKTYSNVVRLNSKFNSMLNHNYTQYFDNRCHLYKSYLKKYYLDTSNDEVEDRYHVDLRYFDDYLKDVIKSYTPIFYSSNMSFIKKYTDKSKLTPHSKSSNNSSIIQSQSDSALDLSHNNVEEMSSYYIKQKYITTDEIEVSNLYQLLLKEYKHQKEAKFKSNK